MKNVLTLVAVAMFTFSVAKAQEKPMQEKPAMEKKCEKSSCDKKDKKAKKCCSKKSKQCEKSQEEMPMNSKTDASM